LHLGKRFGQMPEELRGRLTEARHGVIGRLRERAAELGIDTVLVAGDTFDTETPSRATVRHALQEMAVTPNIRWFLIPGNHDSLQAEELWRTVGGECPDNVTVARAAEPVELGLDAVLLPAPCPVRRPGRDLTEWMNGAETDTGVIRIGLAHGAIQNFGEDGAADVIAPDRAARANLGYLALGDWHGQIRVNERTWYSGTPEPDRFKHDAPGRALIVEIDAPGAAPRVTPTLTGQFLWRDLALDLVAEEDPAERLRQAIEPLEDRRNILVSLAAAGRLGLEARAALNGAAGDISPDFALMTFDDSRLAIDHSPDDLDAIDKAGALRQAAEALLSEARDETASGETRRVAERALSRLYSLGLEYDA
jgi:DNA repair exonuclease SbcCD nuclease subunit